MRRDLRSFNSDNDSTGNATEVTGLRGLRRYRMDEPFRKEDLSYYPDFLCAWRARIPIRLRGRVLLEPFAAYK